MALEIIYRPEPWEGRYESVPVTMENGKEVEMGVSCSHEV